MYYIHKHDALTEDQKTLIQNFSYSDELQSIIDYVVSYYESHTEFSMQHIIENADLSISTRLIDIVQSHLSVLDEIDIELVMNNLQSISLDENIEYLMQQLQTSDQKQAIQQEIQKKRMEKQALQLQMRRNKFKN